MSRDKIVAVNKIQAADSDNNQARDIAHEIARQVSFHIETMYPEAVKASPSTFLLSVRGCVTNAIMNIREDKFGMTVKQWIEHNKQHRRKIRKFAKAGSIEELQEMMEE